MCIWHPEADSLTFDDSALDIVYYNNHVDSFMNSIKKLGIAGIKGQGKTFLIKAKRRGLEKNGSSLLLPKDSVMIDSLNSDIIIRSKQKNFFSSYTNWVSIWKLALAVTILQHPEISNLLDSNLNDECKEPTLDLLSVRNDNHRPSTIIYQLLGMSVKQVNIALSDLSKLMQRISYIDRSICVFIDKTDQAFSHHAYPVLGDTNSTVGYRNASIWQYSQLALANASYDIFVSSNRHIKVFYTIRQEALLDAEKVAPNTYRNFSSFITTLEYSKDDLYSMFSLYVMNEKSKNLREPDCKENNPEKAFVGVTLLSHGYVKDSETLFSYIYRHTMGRASDIQQICYDLFMENVKNLDIDKIRHIVNKTARKLLKEYIAEIEPFTIKSSSKIPTLLSGLNTNAFDIRYMKRTCKRYMLSSGILDNCKMQCKECFDLYPFCELYNIGLLGYLHINETNSDEIEQRFVSPAQRLLIGQTASIPNSPLFFLHPAVSDLSRDLRNNCRRKFENTHSIIVGNTLKCSKEKIQIICDEMDYKIQCLDEENVFISSTMKDFHDIRVKTAEALLKKGYYPVYYESPEYRINTISFTHDACIDEILSCQNFVTIFGEKYGGEYAGGKYQSISQEIIDKSKGRIQHPSITLMEYYTARKNKKKFIVFMMKSIEVYHDSEEYQKRKGLSWTEKSDMDKMAITLDFINHVSVDDSDDLPHGNAIVFINSSSEIEEVISNHSFT